MPNLPLTELEALRLQRDRLVADMNGILIEAEHIGGHPSAKAILWTARKSLNFVMMNQPDVPPEAARHATDDAA